MVVLPLLLVVQSLATADLCQSGSMEHSETAMESVMVLLCLQRHWQQRQLLDHIMGILLARLGLHLRLSSKICFMAIIMTIILIIQFMLHLIFYLIHLMMVTIIYHILLMRPTIIHHFTKITIIK